MSNIRHTPADEPFFTIRVAAGGMSHGARIAAHRHDWHQLIYVQSGVLSVTTDTGAWVAPPRWAVWAEAKTVHAIHFHGACRFSSLYVRPRRGTRSTSRVIVVSDLLAALISRVSLIGMLDRRIGEHRAMANLILQESGANIADRLTLPLPQSPELTELVQALRAVPADRRGTASLAHQFGLSARTLERKFRYETGLSFGHWRIHARFLHAVRLMAEGRRVSDAAQAAGYGSSSAFIAAFAKVFQTTPGKMFAQT